MSTYICVSIEPSNTLVFIACSFCICAQKISRLNNVNATVSLLATISALPIGLFNYFFLSPGVTARVGKSTTHRQQRDAEPRGETVPLGSRDDWSPSETAGSFRAQIKRLGLRERYSSIMYVMDLTFSGCARARAHFHASARAEINYVCLISRWKKLLALPRPLRYQLRFYFGRERGRGKREKTVMKE